MSDRRNSLSGILLRKTVAWSMILGSFFGVMQVILDFDDQHAMHGNAIDRIISVTSGTAAGLAFAMDEQGGERFTNGLLETPYISAVTLTNEFGDVLATDSKMVSTNPWTKRLTEWFTDRPEQYDIDLTYHADSDVIIGQLRLTINWDYALQAFYRRAITVFFTGLIRSLALAVVLYFIIKATLTSPLIKLSTSVRSHRKPEEFRTFRLPLPTVEQGTELTDLATSINHYLDLNA
ncbi:MAG: hypothetical protein ACYTF0_07805, partial [Planctomycetota bacterium]